MVLWKFQWVAFLYGLVCMCVREEGSYVHFIFVIIASNAMCLLFEQEKSNKSKSEKKMKGKKKSESSSNGASYRRYSYFLYHGT
jgi:hypothetical protein